MRPRAIDELIGQEHLLAAGAPLHQLVSGDSPMSVILWGPPGSGKTTVAHLVARSSQRRFVALSALSAGVKDVREVIAAAKADRRRTGRATVLFIDEVHRFTKTQQDSLLAAVEDRTVTLLAATTENPYFSVVSPLLSRCVLLTLRPLDEVAVGALVDRALTDERGLAGAVTLTPEARDHLVRLAGGDVRKALTALEAAASAALAPGSALGVRAPGPNRGPAPSNQGPAPAPAPDSTSAPAPDSTPAPAPGSTLAPDSASDLAPDDGTSADGGPTPVPADNAPAENPAATAPAGTPMIDLATIEAAIDVAAVRYDRDGDGHYDVTSAFIKSMRGSDVDAALHWLARMLVAGEDPRFIARRLVIFASEDVGMADPTALLVATAAAQAVALIGLPEGQLNLAQAVVHLATAPKSNTVTTGIFEAIADVKAGRTGNVPPALRDAHYAGAKGLGHGAGYRYPHDDPRGVVAQQYAPDETVGRDYYRPTTHGAERAVSERIDKLRTIIRSRGDS
ncbi:AAA family ATPase [Longispora sp. NPDC051575]|uniref:AAA family ATPase n=1 Tax=Longispora sp. NPDC051575 TaxID=3154943 RepID=UPI003412F27A